MDDQKEEKPLSQKIWEFILSAGGILGLLYFFLGASTMQILAYAIIVGGIVLIMTRHIISFFQELDKNVKHIKEKLEELDRGKDGQK